MTAKQHAALCKTVCIAVQPGWRAQTCAAYNQLACVMLRGLTCSSNDQIQSSVGCAGEGDDVVNAEVAESWDEGHGHCQGTTKDESPNPANGL